MIFGVQQGESVYGAVSAPSLASVRLYLKDDRLIRLDGYFGALLAGNFESAVLIGYHPDHMLLAEGGAREQEKHGNSPNA
jgi:hypothetical protein